MKWKLYDFPTRGYPHTKPYGVLYQQTRTIDPKNIKVKGKVVPAYAMKAHRGSRGIAPFILNLVTRRTSVDNITPRPFKPRERTLISTEKEAGWAPRAVWTFWRQEKCRTCQEPNPGSSRL